MPHSPNSLVHRLDRIERKLDRVTDLVARQEALGTAARARLDGLFTTVFGNGRDGLTTRMARLETARRVWSAMAASIVGIVSAAIASFTAWALGRG